MRISMKLLHIKEKGNQIYNQCFLNFTRPNTLVKNAQARTTPTPISHREVLERDLRIYSFFLTSTPFDRDTLRNMEDAMSPLLEKSVISSS